MDSIKNKISILIADDSATNNILLKGILNYEGFTNITTCHNGTETIKEINSNEYDLIILDKCMPGKSGLEVIAEIKQSEKHASTPIIMVSANLTTEDVVFCNQIGVHKCYEKPLNIESFSQTILQLFS